MTIFWHLYVGYLSKKIYYEVIWSQDKNLPDFKKTIFIVYILCIFLMWKHYILACTAISGISTEYTLYGIILSWETSLDQEDYWINQIMSQTLLLESGHLAGIAGKYWVHWIKEIRQSSSKRKRNLFSCASVQVWFYLML